MKINFLEEFSDVKYFQKSFYYSELIVKRKITYSEVTNVK